MRALLEFDLPDEAQSFRVASNAEVVAAIVEDALLYIRSRLNTKGLPDAGKAELEELFTRLAEASGEML